MKSGISIFAIEISPDRQFLHQILASSLIEMLPRTVGSFCIFGEKCVWPCFYQSESTVLRYHWFSSSLSIWEDPSSSQQLIRALPFIFWRSGFLYFGDVAFYILEKWPFISWRSDLLYFGEVTFYILEKWPFIFFWRSDLFI